MITATTTLVILAIALVLSWLIIGTYEAIKCHRENEERERRIEQFKKHLNNK